MDLEGMAEAFIQGGTFGVSNLLGITGKNGLIHDRDVPEEQAILVDEDGLYFIENKIQIGWDDVVEITDLSEEDTHNYQFELRGGLRVVTGWVVGEILECIDKPCCKNENVADLDSNDYSTNSLSKFEVGMADVFWMIDLARQIRGSEHLVIDEEFLMNRVLGGYAIALCLIEDSPNRAALKKIDRLFKEGKMREWRNEMINQVACLGMESVSEADDTTMDLLSHAFLWSQGNPFGGVGSGVARQKQSYDVFRNAWACGCDVECWPFNVLTSTEGEDRPFGDESWSNERKMIVCTDEKPSLDALANGINVESVMVMDATDIRNYNDGVEDGLKLKFDSDDGFPHNGVSYIQHPACQREYLSVDAYHKTMLIRKYKELKTLLTCLGARKFELDVESQRSSDRHDKTHRHVDASIDVSVAGEASGGHSSDEESSNMESLRLTLCAKRILRPKGNPYVPTGLEFYPQEKSWQELAKLAIEGRIETEEVSLSYRNESSISGSRFKTIRGKLRSLVPGYQFGAEGTCESKYERELKMLEAKTWHYKVEFAVDAGAGDGEAENAPHKKTKLVRNKMHKKGKASKNTMVGGNGEVLLLKFAKRYAKSEAAKKNGGILGGQREDLERMAKRYGIDEARLDEIILEAIS